MGRFARVVVVDVPHHITQRGNARQVILDNDGDRMTYLGLLRRYSQIAWSFAAGLLSDVQPRAFDCGPAHCGGDGTSPQTGSRALRLVLECTPFVQRPLVAGPILFLSAR